MDKTIRLTIVFVMLVILINTGFNSCSNIRQNARIADLEQEIAKTWNAIEVLEHQIDTVKTLLCKDSVIEIHDSLSCHQKAGYYKIDMNE